MNHPQNYQSIGRPSYQSMVQAQADQQLQNISNHYSAEVFRIFRLDVHVAVRKIPNGALGLCDSRQGFIGAAAENPNSRRTIFISDQLAGARQIWPVVIHELGHLLEGRTANQVQPHQTPAAIQLSLHPATWWRAIAFLIFRARKAGLIFDETDVVNSVRGYGVGPIHKLFQREAAATANSHITVALTYDSLMLDRAQDEINKALIEQRSAQIAQAQLRAALGNI